MKGIKLNYTHLFFALEAAYWASYCSLYVFVVTALTDYGYDTVTAGILTTAMALGSVAVQFVMGYISDTFLPAKRLIMLMAGLGAVGTLFLPSAISHSMPVMLAAFVGISLLDQSLHSTIDAWAVTSIPNHPEIDFAIARSGGSIGYALTAFILGFVTVEFGINVIFISHAVLSGIVVLLCLLIEEVPCRNSKKLLQDKSSGGLSMWGAMLTLLKNKPYMQFMLAMIFLQFTFRPYGTYLHVVVQYAGGNNSHMGTAVLVGAGLEVLALWVGSMMVSRRGTPMSYIMAIGMVCASVRAFSFIIPNVWALIALQIFQAVGYGCYLQVFTRHISEITPKELNATATTMGTALSMGIGNTLGNLIGGVMFERFGTPPTLIMFGVSGLVALAIFWPSVLRERRQKIANNQTA